ncbi:hypothetical protein AB0M35_02250 [Micromonospora sp. NPDC051196]|uniref:hypothetical protein n=1 Tax=Micromonospora sp. NPDC051196 TaxID=3155281 RepID=UPI003420D764
MDIDDLDKAFTAVGWESVEDVHNAGDKALAALSDPYVLGGLFARMRTEERLRRQCERFNLFTKIVLHDSPETGIRLRLHVFGDQMVEEAHNHRASFIARILHGGYRHLLFGSVDDLWSDGVPQALPPRMVHDQYPGHSYTLHHAFVHSTLAQPNTVSLVIQGPRVRPEFKIIDLNSWAPRTRLGAQEAAGVQEAGESVVSDQDVDALHRELLAAGILR